MHTRHSAQVVWLFGLICAVIGVDTSVTRAEALFVRGAVSGEWAAPIDTVVIDSFAWVAQAETLHIAPGMVVAFSGRFSLVVNGTLLASGTNDDSIFVQRTPYHDSQGHLGFRFRNATTVSRLNHVLFEDGFANVGSDERYGGAIEVYQSEVEIDSCAFRGNRARIDGGAIYCRDAAVLTVRDCDFSGDSTRFGGGGAILARTSGTLTIERCRFENNKAITSGGAVMVEGGVTPRIENCYFANNIALQRGGAVQLRSSPVAGYMRDCVIEACTADLGGALYLDNTRATIEACSLRLCDARVGGGIAARGSNNTSPILQTVISGNSATEDGGGFYFVESARCVITNSIIVDNRATRGGAVYGAVSSAPVLRFVTIDGNAATEGSAVSFNGAGILTSSIVTGEDSLIYFAEHATSQIRFSDIFSIEGNELTGVVPDGLLRETRLNVALVECDSLRNISRNPEFVNAESGDFRLTDNSPCLFGADTSNSSGNDFAGELRVAPAGSWPDLGAFESDAPLPLGGNCGSVNGVWYPGDYIIPCSLRVERQDTLIIMAGSRLLFAPGANLYVKGTLLALGTERDSIIFDRYFELPGSTWGGITFWVASGSRFEYSSIRRVEGASAVNVELSDPVFEHCTFSSNTSEFGEGAGIYAWLNSNTTIDACRFVDNSAASGAAIAIFSGRARITNCLFERNVASPEWSTGGAIIADGETHISGCRFVHNKAFLGGAVYGDNVQISDCEFDSCSATLGGAICLTELPHEFEELQFRNNYAKERGGAVYSIGNLDDHRSTYIENRSLLGGAVAMREAEYAGDSVTFNNNFADSAGGAIWLDNLVTGSLNFCTLTRNHALDGGAIYADSAEIQLTYCLLDSNYATRNGGGIFLDEGISAIRKSTCVNHRAGGSGAVMFATENSVPGANSSLFADNGELPIRVGDPLDREFYFCLSDEPIAMPWEPIGLPPAVNFNGDSCDSRMNLIMEPGFVNAAGRDYHLLSTSHAMHAADSLLPLDADGTRADIGLYSGVRPYHVPQPFNLAYPERNGSFHPGDSIVFVWNEAVDYDPGDTVTYSMRLVGGGIDTTIFAGTERSAAVRLFNGEYHWWVMAFSQRPETPRESFERRRFVVSDPALDANSGMIPLEFGVKLTGPNPFNNNTQLELALPHAADVSIVMHDVLGREAMHIQQSYTAGVHTISVNGRTLASGVYWVTVRVGEELGRVKVMLLK